MNSIYNHLGVGLLICILSFSCSKGGKSSIKEVSSLNTLTDSNTTNEGFTDSLSFDNNGEQSDLLSRIVESIVTSDPAAYMELISDYADINGLFPYRVRAEEEEINYSLLGLACRYGEKEIVCDLVDRGADINIGSEDEIYVQDALYCAITCAIPRKDKSIITFLLDKGADVNSIYTEDGFTALSLAVVEQKEDIVELLIKRGANVNGIGDMGTDYIIYPLHNALDTRNIEIIKILLLYGADPLLKDKQGYNAIDYAKEQENKEVLKLLTKSNE